LAGPRALGRMDLIFHLSRVTTLDNRTAALSLSRSFSLVMELYLGNSVHIAQSFLHVGIASHIQIYHLQYLSFRRIASTVEFT
jgi:hypothetical protein